MKMLGDPLGKAALSFWPDVAREAGLAPHDWAIHPLARREDKRVERILFRMVHPGGQQVVFKHEARPTRPEEFMQAMAAHLAAYDACPKGVPELLAFDVRTQTCVMAYLPAEPLSVVLGRLNGLASHLPVLRRVGAWASAFHRGGIGEPRTFQPKFTFRYLHQIMNEVSSGQRRVVDREDFLSCAESLCRMQPDFEGKLTVSAQTHGDLHMRNVLVNEDQAWGIDFAGGRIVPVGHDIARLLVDYATLRAPNDRVPNGTVLPAEAMDAFFDGYDLVGQDDPSVQLLLYHRILADWWGLPLVRSAAQDRRWHGLQLLARRVFAEAFAKT